MNLELFKSVVGRFVFYEAESDEKGARVYTSLNGTPCPRCGEVVQPDVIHLCGNRLTSEEVKAG